MSGDEFGDVLAEGARRALDAVRLPAEYAAIGPRAGRAAERSPIGPGDASAVRTADALFFGFDPDRVGAPDARAGSARGAGGAGGLAPLVEPLRLAVRFQRSRSFPGTRSNRGAAIDAVVFGDRPPFGAAPAPGSEGRFLESAWHYARRHGRRGVTLVRDGAASELIDRARGLASDFPELDFGESDAAALAASDSFAPGAPRDIFVASGRAGERFAARVADLAGGAGFVPVAWFGEESAAVAAGVAGTRRGPAGARHAPIAALLAAALLCEWLGETGRAARIERAVARAIAAGLPEFRDRTRPARARRAAAVLEAIAKDLERTQSAGAGGSA